MRHQRIRNRYENFNLRGVRHISALIIPSRHFSSGSKIPDPDGLGVSIRVLNRRWIWGAIDSGEITRTHEIPCGTTSITSIPILGGELHNGFWRGSKLVGS
jgi:hypothetical protein